MKTMLTYRIIALLSIVLMFSLVIAYSTAHVVLQGEPAQQKSDASISARCHHDTKKNDCKTCVASINSNCCQHSAGDSCDNGCGHAVVSIALTSQLFADIFFSQDNYAPIEKITISIDLDTDLRPPQFA